MGIALAPRSYYGDSDGDGDDDSDGDGFALLGEAKQVWGINEAKVSVWT